MICGHRRPLAAPPVRTSRSTSMPGDLLDDVAMAAGDVGGALLDGPEALRAPGPLRAADVEADEAGRRVHPAARLHDVGEDPEDAVGAGRHRSGPLLEHVVDVGPAAGRLLDLRLAEGVAEPAHDQPAVEADPLHHPAAVDGVAERAQALLGVDERLVEHDGVLPERAAHHGEAPGLRDADAQQRELRVGAARHHRGPFAQACVRGRRGGDRAHHLAAAGHAREDRAIQPADLEDAIRPVAVGQLEHAGARTQRAVRDELAAQPREDPVAEHADVGDRGEHVRLVAGDPAEARRRGDRHPVARAAVDLARRAGLDQLGDLSPGPSVGVRARPQFVAGRVVEHHALAHAGRADRLDRGRRRARGGERVTDAGADEVPVPGGVERLRAWDAVDLGVGVLALAAARGRTVRREQQRPAAPRAGVDGQQELVAHLG